MALASTVVDVYNNSTVSVLVWDVRGRSIPLLPKQTRKVPISYLPQLRTMEQRGAIRIAASPNLSHVLAPTAAAVILPGHSKTLVPVPKPSPHLVDKVFLTCGFGDFMALESFLTANERTAIKEMYLTVPKQVKRLLIPFLPTCFPNLQRVINVFDDFDTSNKVPPFDSARQLMYFVSVADALRWRPQLAGKFPDGLYDMGTPTIRAQFLKRERSYTGSSFLTHKLADISRFKLPDTYVAMHLHSVDRMILDNRNVSPQEWASIVKYLEDNKVYAVVINDDTSIKYAPSPWVIDLAGQTSMAESIEIVKGATGYIGAGSCLVVLATKLFTTNNLFVKGLYYTGEGQMLYHPLTTKTHMYNDFLNFSTKAHDASFAPQRREVPIQ